MVDFKKGKRQACGTHAHYIKYFVHIFMQAHRSTNEDKGDNFDVEETNGATRKGPHRAPIYYNILKFTVS